MAKVKVKILKYVGQSVPGDVIEVDEAQAKILCEPSQVDTGGGVMVSHQKAVLLSEVEKMKEMPIDIKKMTAKDMAELGQKNIVNTPVGDAFDKKVKSLLKMDPKEAVERKAKNAEAAIQRTKPKAKPASVPAPDKKPAAVVGKPAAVPAQASKEALLKGAQA